MFENKNKFLTTYKLEDFFYKTFEMIKIIFKDILPLTLIILIPAVLIYLSGLIYFIKEYVVFIQATIIKNNMNINAILPLIVSFLILFATTYIYYFLFLYIYSCISLKTLKTAHGEYITFKHIAFIVLKEKLLKIILKGFLLYAIIMGITVLLILIYIICGVITAVINKEVLTIIMIISGIIFYFAFICFIIWIEYSFSFATHSILYDNSGIFESLPKSFNLVKKNWWRVFGNTFIITLGVSFAVSMITSPILIFSFLPIYIKFFQMYINHNFSNLSSILQGSAVYFAVGGLAVSMILRVAAYALVYPVYYSLMFINLKVRKSEIQDELKPLSGSFEDIPNS